MILDELSAPVFSLRSARISASVLAYSGRLMLCLSQYLCDLGAVAASSLGSCVAAVHFTFVAAFVNETVVAEMRIMNNDNKDDFITDGEGRCYYAYNGI